MTSDQGRASEKVLEDAGLAQASVSAPVHNHAAMPGSSSGIRTAGLTGRRVVETTRGPSAYSPGRSAQVRFTPRLLRRRTAPNG